MSGDPAPLPPTKLGVYRVLSPRAGVHVSPLCLGAMSVGDKWHSWLGSSNKESSFKLLDAQDESSEEFIGEWAEKRGIRDQLFIATKYTALYKKTDPSVVQKVNYVGNNVKNMHISVKASLKKLRTDYIDLLYVHWWDYDTSVEEIMDGLHNLVAQGKVLYLGISDTPAWIVTQANQYAKYNGKTPFTVYQGEWNVLKRSFERDIIPMARSFDMALAPFSVLADGRLRTDAEEQRRKESGDGRKVERTPEEAAMGSALEKVAEEVGAKSITSGKFANINHGVPTSTDTYILVDLVAIAYVMQKTTHVFPIIGGRKVEQLEQNLEALDITLTSEHIRFLESQVPFDFGFPVSVFVSSYLHTLLSKNAYKDILLSG
ncbi:putative aryl-alcohol dehydrogenase aad14 [Marasmius crinis-equi]|uniref:Aryl-alcohol dehydrogenase aad14 n=1 Tax=Marasmius crinis-equi TaxID=585013 RepID=A0ABR3EMX8_9AGAR